MFFQIACETITVCRISLLYRSAVSVCCISLPVVYSYPAKQKDIGKGYQDNDQQKRSQAEKTKKIAGIKKE